MGKLSVQRIAAITETASSGVDYSPRLGALCPACGKKAKIIRTLPWEDRIRIRYHKCLSKRCVLAAMGRGIKSIEVDHVPEPTRIGKK